MSYYRIEAHPHAPYHIIIIHNRHRVFSKHWLHPKPMFIRLFIEFPYPKITLLFLFLYFSHLICKNEQQNQFNCKLHCEYKTWLNFKKFTSQSANTDKIKLQLNRCFHKFNSVKYVNVRRKEHNETTIKTRTERNEMVRKKREKKSQSKKHEGIKRNNKFTLCIECVWIFQVSCDHHSPQSWSTVWTRWIPANRSQWL